MYAWEVPRQMRKGGCGDCDVTPYIILILSLTCTPNEEGVGEGLRGVLWILSAKSARCTVKMCDGRRRVRGGPWGWGKRRL